MRHEALAGFTAGRELRTTCVQVVGAPCPEGYSVVGRALVQQLDAATLTISQ